MDDPSVSKVLHLRNLPPETTELEVMALGALFGTVVKVLVMKVKNQGFIELGDQISATRMVDYYANMPATIRLVPSCSFSCLPSVVVAKDTRVL